MCDGKTSHNISSSLPRFNARIFDCRNGLRSNTHFVVVMDEIEHVSNEEFMEEVARYENVYLCNSKDFKVMTRTKRPTFGEKKSGRSVIYRPEKPNFAT